MRTPTGYSSIIFMFLIVALMIAAGCSDETASPTVRPDTGSGQVDVGDVSDVGDLPDTPDVAQASCDDGVRNGDETDIDCGGPDCAPCSVGGVCEGARDCDSGVCRQGACAPATCDDGLLNGDETDIDCGGPHCGTCRTGSICAEPNDCISGECEDGLCIIRSCGDVECADTESCYRGACYPACESSASCAAGSRCYEGHCAPFGCDSVACEAAEICFQGVCYEQCGVDSEGTDVPCPALDFTTEEVTNITATSATLHGTLIEHPLEIPTAHGFCWSTQANASADVRTCESLGAPQELGSFSHDATTFLPGQTYYVSAYFSEGGDTFYGNEVNFTTLAPAPANVQATAGTSADYVEVTWQGIEGATGYQVLRDGVAVDSVDGEESSFQDGEASPSSGPGTPADVSATRGDHTDRVEVSWSGTTTSDNATRHAYTVIAIYPSATSIPSAPATGHRAPSDVSAYELQIDDGSWFDVGLELGYQDNGAPEGVIGPGVATATSGEHADRVAVALMGASTTNGASVSYRVRAVTAQGAQGAPSQPVTGYRGVGPLTYQWQRSAGEGDQGYADLLGATQPTFDDTTAPNDGTARYYRARLEAEGASSQNSVAAQGYRAVAATVSSDNVANITATSATLHGTISALGIPLATVHGFCWGSSPAPSTGDGQGTTCQSLGAPSQPGPYLLQAGGLTPGMTYYMRAYATNNAGTVYGSDISFVTPPAAPTGVSASNGTSPNYVRVTWMAAAGADQYRVMRNGQIIATINGTSYDDTEAGAGGLHAAPALTATQGDHTDRVALEWLAPSATNGATHSYTVVAIKDGVAGEESASDTGYRGPYPITHYELRIDAGPWSDIGQLLSHDDTDAPEGTLNVGVGAASNGLHIDHVALELSSANTTNGATRTYRVRAVSVAGAGSESAPTNGYRGVGNVSIQWQRSTGDSDSDYANLAGATALGYNDTSAPASGAARYYRAVVNAPGASEQISNADRGFRAALPTVITNPPVDLGAQVTLVGDITILGAPNPTAHGFCWGTTQDPDILEQGDTTCEDLGGAVATGEFSFTVTNASANTFYYARAFATTNAGTTYGANVTFEIEWAGIRTFSHCGQTGRTGPTQAQCDGTYSGSTLAGEVTLSQGIQRWTVPTTGTYRIEAWGAQGGAGGTGTAGGLGARMRGDVMLTQGQVVHILVGQEGGTVNAGGGGGGGSFVVLADNTPLVIAGGGGGGNGYTGYSRGAFNGGQGLTSTAGGDSNQTSGSAGNPAPGSGGGAASRGGSNGYGGGGGVSAGGGGFFDRGGDTSYSANPGLGYLAGGAGGTGNVAANMGGFGGGGGGQTSSGYGGGGGGYSGGGAGNWNGTTHGNGGGGGSFNSGANPSNAAGARTGHGQVTIDLL